MWNISSGECTGTLHGHTGAVYCVAYDGRTIVSGSGDVTVRVWRAPFADDMQCTMVLQEHTHAVMRVFQCEHLIVSADYLYKVRVHDTRMSGRMVCELTDGSCKFLINKY